MKKLNISAIILSAILFSTQVDTLAQTEIGGGSESPINTQLRGTNIITCSAYEAIKYNGHTLDEIKATSGKSTEIQQLLGSYTSTNTIEFIEAITYNFGANKVSFREGVLQRLEINNIYWPISVTGKTIKVGNSFTEMKQKFGNDLKIIYKSSIDQNYSVSFGCSERGGEGLLIDFDPSTDKVIKIIYFLSP